MIHRKLSKKLVNLLLLFFFCLTQVRGADNYFTLVNKAELEIVSGNFTASLQLYEQAFQINQKPFAIDINNAVISALNSHNYSSALILCRELAAKGVGPLFFTKSKVFSKLQNLSGWNQLLIDAAKKQENIRNANSLLLAYIDSLVEKDQYVNTLWRNAEQKEKRKARDFMDLTYDTISHKLYDLFDSVGFISENIIGVKIIDDTLIGSGLPFDVIIIHNYQARLPSGPLFTSVLNRAFTLGLISPKYYASIQGFGGGSLGSDYKTSGYFVKYNCNIYRQKMSNEALAAVNKLRASIHLDSLDENLTKLVFNIKNPYTKFILSAHASTYMNFVDKSSENNFFEDSELILENVCK